MGKNILLLILLCLSIAIHAQDSSLAKWSFPTGGKVLSHPVIDENVVYFGSDDKSFYAVDIGTGKKLWQYTTRYMIRGKAQIRKEALYVISGNDVHALDKESGKEIWSFRNANGSGADPIDYWDYHTGAPIIDGSTLYAGLGDGYVYGFDTASGKITSKFATMDTVPVRSGLLIENSILYFGDWNGKVYAYDLKDGRQMWVYSTFTERPYPTFGAVNTQPVIHQDLLIFGGRNPELQVISKKTGRKIWSYTEKEGGWISGDPLVAGDTLYIGGSDNHEMFAFNVFSGERYWTYKFLYNNFSRPLAYKDLLLFTIGDAYTVYGNGSGRGYVYALNRSDGRLKNMAVIAGNTHTNPVLHGGTLLIGSEDTKMYAIDKDAWLGTAFRPEAIGYDAIDIINMQPNPFSNETLIEYLVNYPGEVSLSITDLGHAPIRNLFSGTAKSGDYKILWDGKDDTGQNVDDGYYFVKVSSKEFYRTAFIQKSAAIK